jgi:AcrR family transcriptional regulator
MDNRQKILDTALSLFSRKGFESVGIQEICTECTITKPTLYHYFGSKRGLLDALFEQSYPSFLDKVALASKYNHDLVMNLEALANVFFTIAKNDPRFTRLSLIASFSPVESEIHDAQKKYSNKLNAYIEELFRNAVGDHGNMRNKEKQLSLSFIGLLRSYSGFELSDEVELNVSVLRAIVKQFMHGIFS